MVVKNQTLAPALIQLPIQQGRQTCTKQLMTDTAFQTDKCYAEVGVAVRMDSESVTHLGRLEKVSLRDDKQMTI